MAKLDYTCDVAIIGAGPAGSMLAYLLARDGIRVALVEKETFPRNKVCAGGLPAKVLRILPFDISSVIEREIFEVTVTHRLGSEFTKTYSKPLVYTAGREKFDSLLAEKAGSAGALFLDGQKFSHISFEDRLWAVKTDGASIKARVLAGADGAHGAVARTLSLRPCEEFHTGLQVEVPIRSAKETIAPDKRIAFDWGMLTDSYGWIFPKRETLCIGVKGPMSLGRRLMDYLESFLSHYRIPWDRQKLSGHLIPHRLRNNPITTNRALLVGDAAGLADFWTGEGIFHAIRSSETAAPRIRAFLEGRIASLQSYEEAINQRMMPELQVSYRFSRAFNYVYPLIFEMVKKYEYPWDTFCRIMRGDRTFSEVKKRLRPDTFLSKLLFKNLRAHDTHRWTPPREKSTRFMARP
jgi:geranylgeranyl reductase family protein